MAFGQLCRGVAERVHALVGLKRCALKGAPLFQ
jgi:hypothetical protein